MLIGISLSKNYYIHQKCWADLDWNDEWTGKCAVVSTESDGLWWLDNCGEIHNYICEYPRNGYTNPPTSPTTPPPPEAQCEGPEWVKVNNHCYRYVKKSYYRKYHKLQ